MANVKILVCGDVKGRIADLMKRLGNVNKKAGPFEMVICTGIFFNDEPEGDGVESSDAILWNNLRDGKAKLPVYPIYLLGPVNRNQVRHFKNLDGCELAPDIIYLGRAGCFHTNELSIAYISGKDGNADYEADCRRLKTLEIRTKCDDISFKGVDILLTTDWPKGITNNAPISVDATEMREKGSHMAAYLAHKLKPRYHFASSHGIFYERVPYRNHRASCEPARHVTRFISLAEVGNLEKKKWLYAFNIIPMTSITQSELVSQPENATDTPFKETDIQINQNDTNKQFFYATNFDYDDSKRKRKSHGNSADDHNKRSKPPRAPTGPCWFCLSGAEVEKHLIISVGNHSYVALPKGGLTPYHVLILPIAHHASTLELPDEVNEEIDRFKAALKKCFKKELGQIAVFFERNFRSQHLQLQVVPIPKEISGNIKTAFEERGEEDNLEIVEMPEHANLSQMAPVGTPYFYAEAGNNLRLFCKVQKGFPLQFGREVLASVNLLKIEERIDWKECKVSKEEETTVASEFRQIFKAYDFTIDEDSD